MLIEDSQPKQPRHSDGSAQLRLICDTVEQRLRNTHAPFFRELRQRNYQEQRDKYRAREEQRRLGANRVASTANIEKAFNRYLEEPPHAMTIERPSYPSHNKYSQYFPIKVSERLIDEFTKAFPVLKWYKEEGYDSKAAQMLEQMKAVFTAGKSNLPEAWQHLRKKWIWPVDVQTATYMLLVWKEVGMESLDWIQARYPTVAKDAIFEKLVNFDSSFRSTSTIHRNLRISVDSKQTITETSIVKAVKEMFCPICLVYECQDHRRQDIAYEVAHCQSQKECTFCHPKNLIGREEHLQRAIGLLEDYDRIQQDAYVPGGPCSDHCYRQLKSGSYPAYFQKNEPFLSPIVTALVKLGIQMFSYDPCSIFLLTGTDTTCALIYIYLLEDYNLRKTIRQNNYDSEMSALASQFYTECSVSEQPTKKRKVGIAKTKKAKERDANKTNTMPICTHYFLGEDQPVGRSGCLDCACSTRGFCVPLCQCDPQKCTRQRPKCNCKDTCLKESCACYKAQIECDQELCGCVKNQSKQQRTQIVGCANMQVQLGRTAKLRIGCSTIPECGLGAFAGQDICKDHLIAIYKGEMLDAETEALRQLTSTDSHFYTFGFKTSAVDAKYMGGRARFLNHDNQKLENVRVEVVFEMSQVKFSDADYCLCLFAKRNIAKGEELFFDYDGQGLLFRHFRQDYPYIQPKKK